LNVYFIKVKNQYITHKTSFNFLEPEKATVDLSFMQTDARIWTKLSGVKKCNNLLRKIGVKSYIVEASINEIRIMGMD